MKHHESVYGFAEWLTTYSGHVVLVLWNHQPLSMRIILLVLFRCKQATYRATSRSILLLSCFILMNSNSGEINILQMKSCDYLADLFTKSLPASTFEKCVRGIGMRRLGDLLDSGGDTPNGMPC